MPHANMYFIHAAAYSLLLNTSKVKTVHVHKASPKKLSHLNLVSFNFFTLLLLFYYSHKTGDNATNKARCLQYLARLGMGINVGLLTVNLSRQR